jgi:hypothetical protein
MQTAPNERICLDARRHGAVLARPLARSLALAGAGGVAMVQRWPLPALGALLLAAAAMLALRAVCRWDRTRLVVTSEKLYVVHGLVRRRSAAVRLRAVDAVELEQTLPGRLLGYGTLSVGALEVDYVPQARRVAHLVERLAG